jgi:hypothetical protein
MTWNLLQNTCSYHIKTLEVMFLEVTYKYNSIQRIQGLFNIMGTENCEPRKSQSSVIKTLSWGIHYTNVPKPILGQ